MFKRISVLVFLFLGFISISTAQENNIKKFVGTWVGSYEGNGQTYTATLAFKEDNGKLTGIAESTESPTGEPMAVENIVVDGNKLKFEIMSAIKYEGSYNEAKKMIEGLLTSMDGQTIKLDFALKDNKDNTAKTGGYKNFIGTWKGTVIISGAEDKRSIIFIISEKDGIISGTIEIIEAGPDQTDVENLTIKENKIQFEITTANVSYAGRYQTEKKAIEGIITQNGQVFPLNLVKDENAPVK